MNDSPSNSQGRICGCVLAAFGLLPPWQLSRLGGTATAKWRIVCRSGQFVLRLRPAEFADRDATQFDHGILLRLAAAGFPTPRPWAAPSGDTFVEHAGGVYELLTFRQGDPFCPGNAAALHALGGFLARWHQELVDARLSGKEGRLREDHPDLIEPALGGFILNAADSVERCQLATVKEQLAAVRCRLDEGLYASLPHSVIHGDLHPGNLRFRGDEVAAVYDFDYLGQQARLRDLCDALMFFASRRASPLQPDDIVSLTQAFVPDPPAARRLFAGYQSRIALTGAEWQALPWLMRSRWIQMRVRGARKIPPQQRARFVLDHFFDVIDWLDGESAEFLSRLRMEE